MNVREFLKTNEIFTDAVLADFTFFDHTEIEKNMLNHELKNLYGRCGLSEETPEDVHESVHFTLYKYEDKYNNLHKALTQAIDPTVLEIIEAHTTSSQTSNNKSKGKGDTSYKERTFDDLTLSETNTDHNESENESNGTGSGTSEANSTRKRGMTYEDAEALIRLHMNSLYDMILEDVAKDLIIPVYIFE